MGKNQNKTIVLTIVIGVAIVILLAYLIFNFCFSESKKIYADVIVGSNPGFDLNKTALAFGRVQPGFDSERFVFLDNNYNQSVRVSVDTTGKIKDYIFVSENNFILKSGENKTLKFEVFIPRNSSEGKISGFVIIKSKKVGI